MYSMGDPRYVHRPLSQQRREAMSRANRRRLGIPEGCAKVYGVHVPVEHAEIIRRRAADLARRKDYRAAQHFVLRAKENSWRICDNYWSPSDLSELQRRWGAGETGLQIGEALGRSRSAVLGKVSRMGLRRPPKGCSEVPVTMIRPMIAATLGLPEPDDRHQEFRTAMMLVAPMFVAWVPDEMARWTGYARKECADVIYTMTVNGIWKCGKPPPDRYMEGDDKPGLQMGDVALVLDTLLCLGEVRCEYGGDRWHTA